MPSSIVMNNHFAAGLHKSSRAYMSTITEVEEFSNKSSNESSDENITEYYPRR